jgi:hypothetical protein
MKLTELFQISSATSLKEKSYSQGRTNSGYTYANRVVDDQKILEKSITGDELRARAARYKMTPHWYLYANMYGMVPSVSAAVNKKANSLVQCGWAIKDKNGFINQELTDVIERLFGITKLIERASKQYDLYGTVFYGKFQGKHGMPHFRLIPANETRNFIVNTNNFSIDSFSWQENDVFNYYRIHKTDENGDTNFYAGTSEDPDDMFFGAPRLRSLFTTLDGKLRDDENYQLFLRNASFPGIIAMVSGAASPTTIDELDSQLRSFRDPETRFKGGVVSNATDEEGNPLVQFITVKQAIENRLTLEEKREIDGQVYDNLFIPRKLMGLQSSGIGANEYEAAMYDYKMNCIDPQITLIARDLKAFVIPEALRFLSEKGYFTRREFKITEEDVEKIAEEEDFIFEFKELNVELPSVRRQSFMEGYDKGIFLASEVKMHGFGYQERDLEDDDKFRRFKKGDFLVAQGKAVEGLVGEGGGADNVNEDIADEETQSSEDGAVEKSFDEIFSTAQTRSRKSGKVKKQSQSFFAKALEEKEFSRVPEALATPRSQQELKRIQDALKKQYKTLNIKKVLSEFETIKQKALDKDSETLSQDISEFVEFKPTSKILDVEELIFTMLFIAKLGISEAERQTGRKLSDLERKQVLDQVDEYVKARTENLLKGKPQQTSEAKFKILDPYFDGSLDETTSKVLSTTIAGIIKANDNLDSTELEGLIEAELALKVNIRSKAIQEDNLSRSFSVGQILATSMFKPVTKTWLRTTAGHPDNIHLAQVGETIPYEETFADGSFWSQERHGCQCGILVEFKQ